MSNITREKNIFETHSHLLTEWNYEKNGQLDPYSITFGSSKYAWWICSKCGYEWRAKISNRAILGRGCPCCSNRVVVAGVNDLATTHSNLAKEWHPTKNGDLHSYSVTHGSGKKVWWKCPRGHEYVASVLHRVHGTSCPRCHEGRQSSFAEKALFFYISKIYKDAVHRDKETLGQRMELDIYIPSIKFAIEYDGAFWHNSRKAKDRERKKHLLCKKKGINLLRIKECDPNSVVESTSRWTIYVDPSGKNKKLDEMIYSVLEMLDPKANIWRKSVRKKFSVDVNTERDLFVIMGEVDPDNNWTKSYPQLEEEWHPSKNGNTTLGMFSSGSDAKVWWKCSACGYEWRASISHRTNGTGCKMCFLRNNRSGGHVSAKAVYQYTFDNRLIKKWDSISEAARELSISLSNICMCAKGQRRSAGSYKWGYEKEHIEK
ncbi:MAG: hypothetical protein IJC84_03500 [Clostridia bacterium]|nr:hypothetical protein [Clostridia bacterium]